MKLTIVCCESFGKIRHKFDWFSYQDEKRGRVYCMPHIVGNVGEKVRINYCPVCGKEIRDIELL